LADIETLQPAKLSTLKREEKSDTPWTSFFIFIEEKEFSYLILIFLNIGLKFNKGVSIMSRSEDNIIIKLIEEKMERHGWTAYTPDSYASYLNTLTDDEIIEYMKNKGLIE